MLQGTSFFPNPLGGGIIPANTNSNAAPAVFNTGSSPLGSQLLQNPQDLLTQGMGPASPMMQLLPIIAYLLQAITSLLGSQMGTSNAFRGALAKSPSPAPTPAPQPAPAPVPAPAPAPIPQPTPTHTSAITTPSPSGTPGPSATPSPTAANGAQSTTPAATTSASPVNDTAPVTATTQPPNSINVKDLGAKGDGSSDDQAALQKAFDQAKGTGQTVWIPPGTYNHSGVLTADGIKVAGAGDSTTLHATNPDQESIKLTGNGASLSGVKTTVSAAGRSSQPDAAAVLIQNASNASVSHVDVQGAASNGIRVDNSTGSHISGNLVTGSNADGIALMNGSSGNMISHNVVRQAGDDSFSDDSYNGDAKQDEGNTFDGNASLDNAYGRGIVMAGSKNDKVTNNVVSGSKWYGISADSDPNSGTMQSSGHTIQNNTVINNPNGAPVEANAPGVNVSGNQTSGSAPALAAILGWDPAALIDRSQLTNYQPGTGAGASNSGGART